MMSSYITMIDKKYSSKEEDKKKMKKKKKKRKNKSMIPLLKKIDMSLPIITLPNICLQMKLK